jgi:hypothetical protein
MDNQIVERLKRKITSIISDMKEEQTDGKYVKNEWDATVTTQLNFWNTFSTIVEPLDCYEDLKSLFAELHSTWFSKI